MTFEVLSGPHAGLTGAASTDAEGLAKFTYAGARKGTDTIVARFVDSRGQAQTSNTVTAEWRATAVTPTLLAVSPASGVYGETTRLSARLSAGGAPLGGRAVSFSLNGTPVGVATTDADGVAAISNVSIAGVNAGTHQNAVAAGFAGDGGYSASNGTGDLTISKATLTITADNKSRIYNAVNPPLTFTPSGFVNGDTAAAAFNGAPALATTAQTGSGVGTYPITATIGTLSSANYDFTLVPGTLAINQAPTTTVTDGKIFAVNGAVVLTASLLDLNSAPIANRALTLTLGAGAGAQTCGATTDAVGKASCRIDQVMQPLGPGTVSGSFAGDADYLASAGSASTLIFDYPAGVGGSFVIGDLNAAVGKQVSFWGAQWARANALSGGATPSNFKGFGNQTSNSPASCGGTWTSDPGNSAGPPASIPEYMAVLVSSSITKSGSTIAGNIPQVVIVKVSPGYSSNPGHAGTGTVVAVLCH